MSKMMDFYKKATEDVSVNNELALILDGNSFDEATDEQLMKISEIAKKIGFDISVDEARAYFNNDNTEIDDDDLEAVAGGSKVTKVRVRYVNPADGTDTGYQRVY